MGDQDVKGPLDSVVVWSATAPEIPPTCNDEVLRRQVLLFVSTIVAGGTVTAFGTKLLEQAALHPGSIGTLGKDGHVYLGSKISVALEQTMRDDILQHLQDTDMIAASADEPKGRFRLGIRYLFITKDYTAIKRYFWKLAPPRQSYQDGG